MTVKRSYCTGEMPVSPLITDVVRIIGDIRAEPPREPMEEGKEPIQEWSYIVEKEFTIPEYVHYLTEKQEEFARETDEALFELDMLLGGAE